MKKLRRRIMVSTLTAGLIAAGALIGQSAMAATTTYYVAMSGNDSNPGTSTAPFRTIQKGADVAQAGDTVIVREGTYREWVIPKNSGTPTAAITFKAADGEIASIKGSEEINSWTNVGGDVWNVQLNNSIFNGFNPFNVKYDGQWLVYGDDYHLGQVYLNNEPFLELLFAAGEEGPYPAAVDSTPKTWFAAVEGGTTTIWANFGGENPNTNLAEINVRKQVFGPYGFPDDTGMLGIDYITVKGFVLSQAATQWGPSPNPDASPSRPPQEALINTYWSKGWVIENNYIRDSKGICVGSTVHWNNEGYNGHDEFESGSSPGWGWQNLGQHVVRNNMIQRCGQAGIGGVKSWVGSTLEGNLIQRINHQRQIGGFSTGGIKVLFSIDMTIKNNVIRGVLARADKKQDAVHPGIWIDFGGQGTRITGNVIYGIEDTGDVINLEANHGPILVDNNVIKGAPDVGSAFTQWSEHVIFVHNLLEGQFQHPDPDTRGPLYWNPHTSLRMGNSVIDLRDDKYYNNILLDNNAIHTDHAGYLVDHNVYYQNGDVSAQDQNSIHNPAFSPNLSITNLASLPRAVRVTFDANTAPQDVQGPVVNPAVAGTHYLNGMSIEDRTGADITVDTDILGNIRDSTPTAGPLESTVNGTNHITLEAGPDWVPRPLFSDDFENGDAADWTPNSGDWSVITDGTKRYGQDTLSGGHVSTAGDANWTDYSFHSLVKPLNLDTAQTGVHINARYTDKGDRYLFMYRFDQGELRITKLVNGVATVLASKPYTMNVGAEYKFTANVDGSSLTFLVDDVVELTADDSTHTSGRIALGTLNATASFDNVSVNNANS